MADLSCFSNVSEEEFYTLIQKAIKEKTKIARKYSIKIFIFLKGKKNEFVEKNWQFYLMNLVAGVYHQHWLFE